MRETQEAHMMDTCVIYRVTEKTKDKRGTYVFAFDEGTESICGLETAHWDNMNTASQSGIRLTEVDAVLRLPLGTVVKPDDEIEIVKRFGEDVEPARYRVDRFTNNGPSGCRAYLKVKTVL